MGRFERMLREVAEAPPYSILPGLDRAVDSLDGSQQSWSKASEAPGWEGNSATAASAQFIKYARDAGHNGGLVRTSRLIVEDANRVLAGAASAIAELPSTHIDISLIETLANGIPVAIPGWGPIKAAAGLEVFARALGANREAAAKIAVERMVGQLATLAAELDALTSSAIIPAGSAAARGTSASKRPSLADILKDFQVSEDPGGMTEWPGWPVNQFLKPQAMTQTEAEMLSDLQFRLGLLGLFEVKGIRDDATITSQARFPSTAEVPNNDDHTDASRHAYWNARMTAEYGEDWAERFGTAHEGTPANKSPEREAMDLYNNSVGREIAVANPSADSAELADLIEKAVRDGDLVVIGPDHGLAWSDTVPEGGTGMSEEGTPLPGNPDWNDIVDSSS